MSGIQLHLQKREMFHLSQPAGRRLQRSNEAERLAQKEASKRGGTSTRCCCWCTQCRCRKQRRRAMPKNLPKAAQAAESIRRRSCRVIDGHVRSACFTKNTAHIATLQALEGDRLQFRCAMRMPAGVPGSSRTRRLQAALDYRVGSECCVHT